MPDASREDIESFFADTGWSYHRLEGDDWETRYSGTYTNQVITVRMTQYWVYFYATLINRVDEACHGKMFEHLAMLNYKVSFGKFSIDKSNRICLGVEVPRENLQSSVFKDALNAISYLIDEHFRELLNIATDPDYVSRLKLEQESGAAVPPAIAAATDNADEDVDWSDDEGEETESSPSDTPAQVSTAEPEQAASSADSITEPEEIASSADSITGSEEAASNDTASPPAAEASSDNESHSDASGGESSASDNDEAGTSATPSGNSDN